eukprot:10686115-Ditylum_brightwellii.AAC.1
MVNIMDLGVQDGHRPYMQLRALSLASLSSIVSSCVTLHGGFPVSSVPAVCMSLRIYLRPSSPWPPTTY